MFLVMGITGKVGGATAEHLLAHGKKVRALVRNREKASTGRTRAWNWSTAIGMIRQPSSGRSKASKARSSCCRPSGRPRPITKKPKGVIANYVEALTKAAPPRVVALSSMGANRTSGLGMITALSLLEQGFRDLISPIAFVRAGGILRKLPLRLAGRPGRNATGLLQSDQPEIDHGRDERHRRGGRNPFDRASVVGAARRRAWFDGQRG